MRAEALARLAVMLMEYSGDGGLAGVPACRADCTGRVVGGAAALAEFSPV